MKKMKMLCILQEKKSNHEAECAMNCKARDMVLPRPSGVQSTKSRLQTSSTEYYCALIFFDFIVIVP